tara:strand:- start:764 stop:979 length:216 start_codon:yes stop_codon:yes gene_type:complete
MKVHKSSTELYKQISDLKQQVEGYQALLDLYKKQLWDLRKISSENESNKNLLQGYKKMIENLNDKLRQKQS